VRAPKFSDAGTLLIRVSPEIRHIVASGSAQVAVAATEPRKMILPQEVRSGAVQTWWY
jgi:hypothetical protein